MEICFLRHGEADWPKWDKPDDERPLTKRGCREMERVARFLARLGFSPDAILSSPLPRASQTAGIVADELGMEVQIEPTLVHGFSTPRLRRLIGAREANCIVIVGHEPEFSAVVKELTGGNIKLAKGGIALVEVNRGCTAGRLRWLLPPKLSKTVQ